jgi:hypothetical protein
VRGRQAREHSRSRAARTAARASGPGRAFSCLASSSLMRMTLLSRRALLEPIHIFKCTPGEPILPPLLRPCNGRDASRELVWRYRHDAIDCQLCVFRLCIVC